jgi:hypothetical protein
MEKKKKAKADCQKTCPDERFGGAAKLQNQTTKFCFEIFWRKSLRGF